MKQQIKRSGMQAVAAFITSRAAMTVTAAASAVVFSLAAAPSAQGQVVAQTQAQAQAPAGTLYEAIGGTPVLRAVVYDFLDIALADPRVKDTFNHTEMKRLHAMLIEHLCMLTDGPCKYTGDPMKEVHQGLGINEARFNAIAEDFQAAMVQQDVPVQAQYRLMARLAALAPQIITR